MGLFPGVIVLEANDIVFAEVLAVLNFDEDQGHNAGILEAVVGAGGDVGGLVGGE